MNKWMIWGVFPPMIFGSTPIYLQWRIHGYSTLCLQPPNWSFPGFGNSLHESWFRQKKIYHRMYVYGVSLSILYTYVYITIVTLCLVYFNYIVHALKYRPYIHPVEFYQAANVLPGAVLGWLHHQGADGCFIWKGGNSCFEEIVPFLAFINFETLLKTIVVFCILFLMVLMWRAGR